MGRLQSWRFVDPTDTDPDTREYVFEVNPKEMSPPFPERALTTQHSSAPGGQPMTWEGPTPLVEWTFGGTILHATMYETLRSWVYDRPAHVYVYDHFGRRLDVVLKSFAPESPERMKNGYYWYHRYKIKATIYSISAPTVGEAGL